MKWLLVYLRIKAYFLTLNLLAINQRKLFDRLVHRCSIYFTVESEKWVILRFAFDYFHTHSMSVFNFSSCVQLLPTCAADVNKKHICTLCQHVSQSPSQSSRYLQTSSGWGLFSKAWCKCSATERTHAESMHRYTRKNVNKEKRAENWEQKTSESEINGNNKVCV